MKRLFIVIVALIMVFTSVISANYVYAETSTIDVLKSNSDPNSGLYKDSEGVWGFYRNGKLDTSFTGLAINPRNGRWFYVEKGFLKWTYTGFVQYPKGSGQWYYVKRGVMNHEFTGVAKNPKDKKWYYVKNGVRDLTYTGLAKNPNNGKWFSVKKGLLDWTHTGLSKNRENGKWYHVTNGRLDTSYTGISRNDDNNKYYHVTGGVLDKVYSGSSYSPYHKKYVFVRYGKYDNFFTKNASINQNQGEVNKLFGIPYYNNIALHKMNTTKIGNQGGYGSAYTYEGAVAGIDVSEFQGDIDWQKVKKAGIKFVYIRIGGRYYGSGKLYYDSKFEQNYEGATKNGIKVGVYFFSQAKTEAEAIQEAKRVVSTLKGRKLDLEVVYDLEDGGYVSYRIDSTNKAQRTKNALAFCKEIEKYGHKPMVYFNWAWANKWYDMTKINNYPVWYAQYYKYPEYPYNMKVWQYTSEGYVDGISGYVDMNLMFLND